MKKGNLKVVIISIVSLSLGVLSGCGSDKEIVPTETPIATEIIETTEPPVSTEIVEPTPAASEVSVPTDVSATNADMKRVGQENFGFFDIPSDWEEGIMKKGNSIKYTDYASVVIVTVYEAIDLETAMVKMVEGYDTLLGTDAYILEEGAGFQGKEANKVSTYIEATETNMIQWVFETEDGNVNSVTVSTSKGEEYVQKMAESIEASYNLEK